MLHKSNLSMIQGDTEHKNKISDYKGVWASEYFENENPINVEFGCGKGDFILGLAELFPDINYIGVDIDENIILQSAKKIFEENIPNAIFVHADINNIDNFFGLSEINEIWINFPDNQVNRVITGKKSLINLNRLLLPGGLIHVKTNDRDMLENLYNLYKGEGFYPAKKIIDVHGTGKNEHLIDIKTNTEAQLFNQGTAIHYFCFICKK
jgi:tRNA (guanine-N7-)-methyltransferase